MAYYLLAVEGPQDAAFFGLLLKQRQLQKIESRAAVDSYWEKLIPTQFPADPAGKLEHVVRYPDIYEVRNQTRNLSVAIIVAGGDSRIVPEFQAALEILDISQLSAVAVASDADDLGVDARMAQLLGELTRVNTEAARNLTPGFPLALPPEPGFANGHPRVGIHIFPNNANLGTLETVLLECSVTSYPHYTQPAIDFVNAIDNSAPALIQELRLLRRGAGRQKAAAGIIGTLLFPGSSLSVAVDRGRWLEPVAGTEVGLLAARAFLNSLLS